MKEALISAPTLALLDFSKPFLITTDASGQAIGGVLTQEGRPIAYESRKLRSHELNYPTHDLELLAVVHALKMWRHYLLGNSFKIKTNHKSLKWIFTQPDLNMRQRRWMELLHEHDFSIEYQPGKENIVGDALSKKSTLSAISVLQTSIADFVRQASVNDTFYNLIASTIPILNKSEKQLNIVKGFQLVDDLLYFKERLYIPADKELKLRILAEVYDIPIAAHPGYIKLYNTLRKSFYWNGLKRDALSYVTRCLSCQRIKAERVKYPGKLQPNDIPQMKWENISMDFVMDLPTSRGYDSIYVVVDMLTKMIHLFPVRKDASAKDIAHVFMRGIFLYHGLPRRIISDRDSKFTSNFGGPFSKLREHSCPLAQPTTRRQTGKQRE